MKNFGLIGCPIAHSLSPALFKSGYHHRCDLSYDLIEEEDFRQAWQKFLDGYDGINVTAPFKEQAFAMADIIDPVCGQIGATNLLVKTGEGIKAYNTDYYGIILSILKTLDPATGIKERPSAEECREAVRNRLHTALVVGCGGAGKAAAVAAGSLGLETTLMNRTAAKAEAIADGLPEYRFTVRRLEDFRECFAAADLVLYTLPAPTAGIYELTDSDFSPDGTEKILLEANYRNPSFTAETISRQMYIQHRFRYIEGIQWLLYQAYAGYDLFTGEVPDLIKMENAVIK